MLDEDIINPEELIIIKSHIETLWTFENIFEIVEFHDGWKNWLQIYLDFLGEIDRLQDNKNKIYRFENMNEVNLKTRYNSETGKYTGLYFKQWLNYIRNSLHYRLNNKNETSLVHNNEIYIFEGDEGYKVR